MLANAKSLVSLINDKSYDRTVSGKLYVLQVTFLVYLMYYTDYDDELQDEKWRQTFAVLKANLLFFFESESQLSIPIFLLIVEDCIIELSDDNITGRQFSFSIKFKTYVLTISLSHSSLIFVEQKESFKLQQKILQVWVIGYHV